MTAPTRMHPPTRRLITRLATLGALGAAVSPARAAPLALLMRHATAPGTGDPPGFVIGDCATQRNLSAEGRAEAVRAGVYLRRAGIRVDRLLSSRWCRC